MTASESCSVSRHRIRGSDKSKAGGQNPYVGVEVAAGCRRKFKTGLPVRPRVEVPSLGNCWLLADPIDPDTRALVNITGRDIA